MRENLMAQQPHFSGGVLHTGFVSLLWFAALFSVPADGQSVQNQDLAVRNQSFSRRDEARFSSLPVLHEASESRTITLQQRQNLGRHAMSMCFVHVGKCGGGSIVRGIVKLKALNKLDNVVEVHFPNPERNKTRQIRDHEGKIHSWTRVCGPLSNTARCTSSCMRTGNIVLWVRDPLDRLLSSWNVNYFEPLRKFSRILQALAKQGLMKRRKRADLNTIVESIALRNVSMDRKLEDLFSILNAVEHGTTGIAFYLGSSRLAHFSFAERSKDCKMLEKLPIWFVGRSEHMLADWGNFLQKTADNSSLVALPHSHPSRKQDKHLSSASVELLRQYYSAEYECILRLVQLGWLGREYYDAILAKTEYKF